MISSLLLAAAALGAPSPALAADTDIQALRPAAPGGPLVWTEPARVGEGATGRLVLHHADGLLVFTRLDGSQDRIVGALTRADLMGGWGFGRVQVGVGVPVLARVWSDGGGETGLGDVSLDGRLALLQPDEAPLGVGWTGRLVLPTTTVDAPVGGGGVGFETRATTEVPLDAVTVLGNLGVRLQPRSSEEQLPAGSAFVAGAGAAWAVSETGGLTGELVLAPVLGFPDVSNSLPAELLAGGWLDPGERVRVHLGAGVGLGNGVGTPAWRLYASVSPRPDAGGDRDDDDIPDDRDVCPYEPETVNGIRDADGCPEDPAVLASEAAASDSLALESDEDTDGDGIADRDDACIVEPEDPDGLADTDGCPDRDVDDDGVPDPDDQCPLKAETVNGIDDADGCPEAVTEEAQQVAGVVRGITFATGSDRLRPQSTVVLNKVLALLQDNPTWTAHVVGHTDDVGDRDKNIDLSARRAASVQRWLTARGVAAARLTTAGKGPDVPLQPNDTDAGRAENRRVEISYASGGTP